MEVIATGTKRELAALERELRGKGWELARHRTHRVWKSPDGGMVVLPATPSEYRGIANVRSLLVRNGILEK